MEARRLRRQSFSRNSRKPHSVKFVLPCKENVQNGDAWLEVKRRLSEKADVLEGVLSSRKAVVVKYGDPATIEHEYAVSSDLQNEPNFMKYYCSFTCKPRVCGACAPASGLAPVRSTARAASPSGS